LHSLNISCLREDLEKFIVGQEIEAGECGPLSLKIVFKRLLDVFKSLVSILELR
jgi:hypothetical protein